MYQLTMQDVTYRDYPIQYFFSLSTGIEEMDIMDIWDSVLSTWMRKQPKKLFYHSLIPLLKIDLSSIWPRFEIKTETSLIEEMTRETVPETISEEDLAIGMVEHDFVVKMPPKKKYKVHIIVKSIRRGTPSIAGPDDIIITE